MGSQTARGYPYPLGTDRVMDGDDAIRALAEAVDKKLGGPQVAGAVTVAVNNATSGSVTVTLPAGLFAAAPVVLVTINLTTQSWVANSSGTAAASFTILVHTKSGSPSTGNVPVSWMALAAKPT